MNKEKVEESLEELAQQLEDVWEGLSGKQDAAPAPVGIYDIQTNSGRIVVILGSFAAIALAVLFLYTSVYLPLTTKQDLIEFKDSQTQFDHQAVQHINALSDLLNGPGGVTTNTSSPNVIGQSITTPICTNCTNVR